MGDGKEREISTDEATKNGDIKTKRTASFLRFCSSFSSLEGLAFFSDEDLRDLTLDFVLSESAS
jgi:hypothetical protein